MAKTWRSASGTAWRRWRAFAHRAAEIQSRVLLFLLYFALLAPIALVVRIMRRRPAMPTGAAWHPIASPPENLDSARNQF